MKIFITALTTLACWTFIGLTVSIIVGSATGMFWYGVMLTVSSVAVKLLWRLC